MEVYTHAHAHTHTHNAYTPCLKNRTPVTFWHNFINTALMSIMIGMENLRLILNTLNDIGDHV